MNDDPKSPTIIVQFHLENIQFIQLLDFSVPPSSSGSGASGRMDDLSSGDDIQIVPDLGGPSRPPRRQSRPAHGRTNGHAVNLVDDDDDIIPTHFKPAMSGAQSSISHSLALVEPSLNRSLRKENGESSEQARKQQAKIQELDNEVRILVNAKAS